MLIPAVSYWVSGVSRSFVRCLHSMYPMLIPAASYWVLEFRVASHTASALWIQCSPPPRHIASPAFRISARCLRSIWIQRSPRPAAAYLVLGVSHSFARCLHSMGPMLSPAASYWVLGVSRNFARCLRSMDPMLIPAASYWVLGVSHSLARCLCSMDPMFFVYLYTVLFVV